MMRAFLAAAGVAVSLAGSASASQLVGENARAVRLAADGSGRALVTFTSGGVVHHVLAWGAVNARAPSRSQPQVEFRVDTGGGAVRDTCRPVSLQLGWLVSGC